MIVSSWETLSVYKQYILTYITDSVYLFLHSTLAIIEKNICTFFRQIDVGWR